MGVQTRRIQPGRPELGARWGARLGRYALAVVATAAATGVRWALDAILDNSAQYLLYYFSVMLVAVIGGTGAGLLATALGALGGTWLFVYLGHVGTSGSDDLTRLGFFVAFGGMATVLAGRLREAKDEAAARAAELASVAQFPMENPNPVLRIGEDGRVLYTNEAAEALLGEEGWKRGEAAPKELREAAERALASKRASEHEVTCRQERVFSYACAPVAAKGYVNLYGRDVTDARRAEEALRRSEQRLRATFDNAGVGILEAERDDRFIAANDRVCEIFGYRREELLGKTVHELTAPADRARSDELNAALHDGRLNRSDYEKRYVKRDGTSVWVHVTVSAVRDDGGRWVRSIATVEDISERKAAEVQVRLQAAALEAAANGMVLTDPEGTILWVNRAFSAMTGYSAAEAIGQNPRILKSGKQDEAFYRNMWETIRRGEIWHGGLINRRKDGTLYNEEMTIAPVWDERGAISRYIAIKQDITERKRAEEALRESERNCRIVAENTYAWEFWLSPEGRFAYNSPSCLRVTGYEAEAFVADPKLMERIIHPEDQALYAEHRGTGREACAPQELEFRIVRKDGQVRWIGHACQPVYDSDGRFLGIRGSNRDITESKAAETALRESQQMLQLVLDTVPARVFWKDRNSMYLGCNQPFALDAGLQAPEQLMGKTDFEMGWREQAELYRSDDRRVMETGQEKLHYEEPQTAPDGRALWLRTNKVPLRDVQGRIIGMLGTYEDITERKCVEEARRQSEERLRLAVEGADLMVWDFDPETRAYTWTNKRGAWGPESQVRMTWEQWLGLVHEEDRERVEAAARGALDAGGSGMYVVEYRIRRPSGEYRWISARGQTFFGERDGRKQAIRCTGIAADMTERKRAEEALQAAKVSAERAKMEAEEASRAKDHFLAVLSHELRTPLSAVLPALGALEKLVGAEGGEYLDMARRNVELEARLIDDLLDVTRIARGKIELERRAVDLCTVVRRAAEVCMPDIEARGLHFGVEAEGGPFGVDGDAARLQQVFWNLLKNAVKFTPQGGCVGVKCYRRGETGNGGIGETERGKEGSGVSGWVVVEVIDSGEGIEAEALGRIFNAFEQAERSVTRQFGGLGLGLAISRALVEMHGGQVWAESKGRGKGAKFVVELPAAAVASCRAPLASIELRAADEEGGQKRKLRILLVEDHGDTAKIMRRLLMAEGYEVKHAGDLATALELARSNSFDLLLSDLGLPDGSGYDLMRELVAWGKPVKGIAISGYGMAADVQRSREAGFAEHVTKPVNLEALVAVLQRVAGRGG